MVLAMVVYGFIWRGMDFCLTCTLDLVTPDTTHLSLDWQAYTGAQMAYCIAKT